jgi:uncharacterized membrane protein YeaQ/YmgE (transglycosylase-associated protein family)
VFGFLIWALFAGLVIGALGRLVVPGRQQMGCLATALCGIGGSLLGGLIGRVLFGRGYAPGLIMSVIGAALIIWALYGTSRRRRI